jgi:hypothetical protein
MDVKNPFGGGIMFYLVELRASPTDGTGFKQKNTKRNEADINGWTTLHKAAENGYEIVVQLLPSQNGIDSHLVNSRGQADLAGGRSAGI